MIDLLKFVETGGCSAKIPAVELEKVLLSLKRISDPNILVDIDNHDDAGVYKISDDMALIVTTDFFPPVCSDPYTFGQIAATNSLSDVYAMGGEAILALNISMFPKVNMPLEAYAEILRGGNDKAVEAGTIILGGHTIDDVVPKYGLAVVGRVHPKELITNNALEPNKVLILTKPLGSGIIIAAHKFEMVSEGAYNSILRSMMQLNREGAKIMRLHYVKAATDITGFGLAGHAVKMAKASGVSIQIEAGKVPVFDEVLAMADSGCIPCAAFKNLEYVEPYTDFSDVDYNTKMVMCDAQTSGGLMFAVEPSEADAVVDELRLAGYENAQVIGKTLPLKDKLLEFVM